LFSVEVATVKALECFSAIHYEPNYPTVK